MSISSLIKADNSGAADTHFGNEGIAVINSSHLTTGNSSCVVATPDNKFLATWAANTPDNSAVMGIDNALAEVKTRSDWSIPDYLKDAHYSGAHEMGHGNGYLYPHDFGGWVDQQYIPDELKGHVYYKPVRNGEEASLSRRWEERTNKKQE